MVLHQLDASYRSFYALRKNGRPDAMPPGQKRLYRGLSYRQSGWRLEGKNLYLSHIGKFRLRLHRPIEGRIKLVSVTKKNGKWYASFSCEATKFSGMCGPVFAPKFFVQKDLRQEHIPSDGSDPQKGGAHNEAQYQGLYAEGRSDPEKDRKGEIRLAYLGDVFLADSEGRVIGQPEFYFTQIGTLCRLSRALSRKQPGSRNRRKARRTLAKFHEHIANQRRAFLWHIARYYAARYERIIVPKWPLKQRTQYAFSSRAAIQYCDAGYGLFVSMLRHKCNEFGTEVIERKDEEQWQKEIEELTEAVRRKALAVLLRRTRAAIRRGRKEALPSLIKASEQVRTLRI